MSERFGIPDHAPQHAPDHALQNPTATGSWHNIGGGDGAWPTPAAPTYGGAGTGHVAVPYVRVDTPHRTTTAVVLAVLFGPLGLFYIGFLHGVVALFTVIPIARNVALTLAATTGIDRVWLALIAMWCITVPWAIVGVRWRNRRFKSWRR